MVKVYKQLLESIPSQDESVVAITGTTSGVGFFAAKAALSKGATVILLNRESKRLSASVEKLKSSDDLQSKVVSIICDLQDLESVRTAARQISEKFPEGIDALCNNAGIAGDKNKLLTKDGLEATMQTNHLGHFLLSSLLLPLLEKKSGRIVNHSSGLRAWPRTPLNPKLFEAYDNEGDYAKLKFSTGELYHQSKLANSVFTVELQERLKEQGSSVTVYCAHPGFSSTEFLDSSTMPFKSVQRLFIKMLAQSAEDGSYGLVMCMFSKNLEPGGMYGPRYFGGKAVKEGHGSLTNKKAANTLWEGSEKAVGVKFFES